MASKDRTERWVVGAEVAVRALWAKHSSDSGNAARQLLIPPSEATIRSVDDDSATLESDHGEIEVRRVVTPGDGDGPLLTGDVGVRSLLRSNPDRLSWVKSPTPMRPSAVLGRLRGQFRLIEASVISPGFRTPQAGAIHSVLGYWTTEATRDATVVMPTGTGKTDTMVALFAASCPERLLVLVPSGTLRTQVAEKFEELGFLPAIGALGDGPLTYPVVGRLTKGLQSLSAARTFARRCNVVVTTPHALNAGTEKARLAFTAEFDTLFVDEAHHVTASTWSAVRSPFEDKRVVQFTATPYREDRQNLGGKLIYVFPLGLAQQHGYHRHSVEVGVPPPQPEDLSPASTGHGRHHHEGMQGRIPRFQMT